MVEVSASFYTVSASYAGRGLYCQDHSKYDRQSSIELERTARRIIRDRKRKVYQKPKLNFCEAHTSTELTQARIESPTPNQCMPSRLSWTAVDNDGNDCAHGKFSYWSMLNICFLDEMQRQMMTGEASSKLQPTHSRVPSEGIEDIKSNHLDDNGGEAYPRR